MMLIKCFFFFNDTATTEIYTLSLHDALPISGLDGVDQLLDQHGRGGRAGYDVVGGQDRKSTRLNSSHMSISYAVFCLKKKKKQSKSTNSIKKNKNTTIT